MEDQFKFNEEDVEKVVEFLNFIAKNAKFDVDTQDMIRYVNLLGYMQKSNLPKMKANILEIVKVVEPEKKPAARKPAAKGKK